MNQDDSWTATPNANKTIPQHDSVIWKSPESEFKDSVTVVRGEPTLTKQHIATCEKLVDKIFQSDKVIQLISITECQNRTKNFLKLKFFELFAEYTKIHAGYTVAFQTLYDLFEKKYPDTLSFTTNESIKKEIEGQQPTKIVGLGEKD